MSRVHQHIQQAGQLVFIDSSSSFDDYDYNNNIITNDSQAERIGLRRTWPNASMYLCVFHFLQTMRRWLINSCNKILVQHRQHLMQLMRNIVYAKTEEILNHE